ncbi:MAG: response regulator transcription factor [Eisenbergiella massiliensis]
MDINNMTAEFLREKGCIAEQAFSGTEGRLLWQMKEFDLLLLDLMLPGLPGGELLRQIRAASRIPVIVLTAKNSLDDKVELLGGGADDYLTKPFELEELWVRILVQLRHRGNAAGKTLKDLRLIAGQVLTAEKRWADGPWAGVWSFWSASKRFYQAGVMRLWQQDALMRTDDQCACE